LWREIKFVKLFILRTFKFEKNVESILGIYSVPKFLYWFYWLSKLNEEKKIKIKKKKITSKKFIFCCKGKGKKVQIQYIIKWGFAFFRLMKKKNWILWLVKNNFNEWWSYKEKNCVIGRIIIMHTKNTSLLTFMQS
jgi:hypothetical protein